MKKNLIVALALSGFCTAIPVSTSAQSSAQLTKLERTVAKLRLKTDQLCFSDKAGMHLLRVCSQPKTSTEASVFANKAQRLQKLAVEVSDIEEKAGRIHIKKQRGFEFLGITSPQSKPSIRVDFNSLKKTVSGLQLKLDLICVEQPYPGTPAYKVVRVCSNDWLVHQ